MNTITDRILTQIGDPVLISKLSALPKSELYSLLLEIFRKQSDSITPVDLLKSFQINRFSIPSEIDPIAYHLLEVELLSIAHQQDIKGILLSPSAPFASSSAFGCVDQNNVVSAVRGTEILSDSTNMLAIIIAEQLKKRELDNKEPLHFCTTARVLRAQVFPDTKQHFPHFGLFCIVSSGKDSGSYVCEKNLLIKQLIYYKRLLVEKYNADISVIIRKRRGYADGDGFFDRMIELVKTEIPDIPVTYDSEYDENNYYKGIHFKMFMEKDNEKIEIGDGGFVDWIQQMTNNKKERCLISGIGIDRLLL
ncbi:MAG: hypothetical protein FWH33_08005 [Oscillospiraceae bacterium]|nr:hypothetical protein [Oscillospiraceae bacterium]